MPTWDHGLAWANLYPETGFPPKCIDFMDWYILPKSERNPSTAAEWCRQNDVSYSTVNTTWKRDDRVRKEMARRAEALNISSFRTQEVINALFNAATAGDVKAMTSYLEYVKLFQPARRVVIEHEGAENLSDDEIANLLSAERS